jgi:hypothetical protein
LVDAPRIIATFSGPMCSPSFVHRCSMRSAPAPAKTSVRIEASVKSGGIVMPSWPSPRNSQADEPLQQVAADVVEEAGEARA